MNTPRLAVQLISVGALWAAVASLNGCGSSRALQDPDSGTGTGGIGGNAGATAGSSGTGGSGGMTGGSGGGPGTGGGAGGDGGACDCGAFTGYRACCGNQCLNLQNDPFNCGACGNRCPADRPFCEGGSCQLARCERMGGCEGGRCCGASCCAVGQLCCSVEGPISGFVTCHTPTAEQPTCPAGCAPLCISDRNLKDAVEPVDRQEVLTRLSQLPISRWRYRSEADGVHHIGPMAQDFKQVFGLGDSDRLYHAVDAHGVAFAAIQALKEISEQQQRRIERLEREKRALERRLRALEAPGP